MGKQGRIFGYARVSSTEQNLDRQLQALSEYVTPENIITDKQSGKKTEWNVISDDKKKVGSISLDTKIKEGVVLVQKSSDGKTWSNATEPKNEYFAKKTGDNSVLYTTSLDEVKQRMERMQR